MDTSPGLLELVLNASEGEQMLLLALLGGAVFMVVLAVLFAADRKPDPVKNRVLAMQKADEQPSSTPSLSRKEDSFFARMSYLFMPRGQQARKFTVGRLQLAGYRSLSAFATYYTIRSTLMVVLPLTVCALPAFMPAMHFREIVPYALGAFLVGMIGPSYFLDKRIESRQRAIRHGLPDALDMLVVCTEAGLGLNAALLRVARDLDYAHPELSAELAVVNAEIRAGIERSQALRDLVERTGLEDLKALVVVLVQSLRFGTSISMSLRVYSEEFRDKRLQAAEEAAAKLSTKMIFPLIFCFLPGFFIVAVGPAFLRFVVLFAH